MPPKKRPATAQTQPRSKAKNASRAKRPRPLDPAIRAAFQEYASPGSDAEDASAMVVEDMLITIPDVRRALRALKYPTPPADFFDDDAEAIGWVEFGELAVAMRESVRESDADMDDEQGSGGEEGLDGELEGEIDEAFALFLPQGKASQSGMGEQRITVADLRRIARELKEDVDEGVLKLMIEEACGDGGVESIRRGIGRIEFESVMRRAGVF